MINIFFNSDNNYAQHLGVTICSILCNSSDKTEYCFYILDGGITDENKSKIENLKKIQPFNISYLHMDVREFEDFYISHHFTQAAYYRLKIPSLVPGMNKALYLDCDIIVKKDLTELWETDLAGKTIGAVEDVSPPPDSYRRLGFPESDRYFNAGVLSLNIERMRHYDIELKLIDYIKNNPDKILMLDQDALNAVLHSDWFHLNPKWNRQSAMDLKKSPNSMFSREDYRYAYENPSIIHYSSPTKPWHYENSHELKKEYWKYLKMTEWKDFTYEDFTLRKIIKKHTRFIKTFKQKVRAQFSKT